MIGDLGSLGDLGVLGGPSLLDVPFMEPGAAFGGNGDSILGRGNFFTTAAARTTAENRHNSEMGWVHFFLGNVITRNYWDNTATAANLVPTYAEASATDPLWRGLNLSLQGDTSTGGTRRAAQVVAVADLILDALGTNQGAGDNYATVIAKDQERWAIYRAAGVPFIVTAIRPRRVTEAGVAPDILPATRDRNVQINAWRAANWKAQGAVGFYNPWEALRDHAYDVGHTLYGTVADGYTIDGVHLSSLGAYIGVTAGGLLKIVRSIVKPGRWFTGMTNLFTVNPTFSTATGGTVGLGAFGTIPQGWAISNAQGSGQPVTVTASMESGAIVLDINSTGAGAANTFNTIRFAPATAITTGYTATDWAVSVYHPEVVTPNNGILVMAQGTLGQTSTISARGMGQPTSSYNNEPSPMKDFAMSGWIATEPLLCEARTNLTARLDLSIRQDLAGDCRVKIHPDPHLVLVPDPSVAYAWTP